MTTSTTDDLLHGYQTLPGAYDDMLDDGGNRRPHWDELAAALAKLEPAQLARTQSETRRLLDDDGVTYYSTATGAPDQWQLDPVPAVLSGDEWASLEAGIVQRSMLLDLVLSDLYGPRDLVHSGSIPPEIVYGHPGFLLECDGVKLRGRHQLFLSATDVARDHTGQQVALSDRTQAPSGAGYALENRTVVSRVMPSLYRANEVQRLAPFFRDLRASVRSVAPETAEAPRVVVLSPGPRSETAFEHALLASHLGYPLVQGADMRVRDGRVWMRALGRLEPVHVIIRRVDAGSCDPLELDASSHLGVPGLVEACRLGTVSVVNTLGSGVLESPALLPYLPALCRELLDEDLRLASVTTWWCGEPSSLSHVVANLDRLVIKPVARGLDTNTHIGWELDHAQLDELRRRIVANPNGWVGQDPVQIGTVPTLVGERLVARRSILRAFAVATDDGYSVMPGGLTRVAADHNGSHITNQSGALSKDTWVLSDAPEQLTGFWLQTGREQEGVEPETSMSSRAAENLFWMSRYAERAETVVRLVRVGLDRQNEFSSGTTVGGHACLDVILAATTHVTGTFPGFVGPDGDTLRSSPSAEFRSLVCDADRAGTLAFDVKRMLEAASEVRDQLSIDTWLAIGNLDRDLARIDSRFSSGAAQATLGQVMLGLLALSGLSSESLVRDAGWQFLEVGRRIERAIQLCQLLSATVVRPTNQVVDSLVLESTLMSTESIITYRRRYRGLARIETVLDLLILDPDNPRSLGYQLIALADQLGRLPGSDRTRPRTVERLVQAVHADALAISTQSLARIGNDGSRQSLAEFLASMIAQLAQVATSFDNDFFSHQLPQQAVFMPNAPGPR